MPPRRQQTGAQGHQKNEAGHSSEGDRIGGIDPEMHSLSQAGGSQAPGYAQSRAASQQEPSPLFVDTEDVPSDCTQSDRESQPKEAARCPDKPPSLAGAERVSCSAQFRTR